MMRVLGPVFWLFWARLLLQRNKKHTVNLGFADCSGWNVKPRGATRADRCRSFENNCHRQR